MAENVIEVEHLSKLYRLGAIGTGSLRQDIQFWLNKSLRKKHDPFFGEIPDESSVSDQYIWALKDVSFQVPKGEALGIIGSNGSGKSTLLKIISRIIQPTRGSVKGRGKIGSILEVGTGFHHELSGRENIFMSGYTLGMSKAEVLRKFDEIVAFSGIEKFIDTPVKRYSSGMYVRLAFAVAAHLEPEILIVDEVLAVGDADFQRKCMGKMQEVSSSKGRTILFVSHNMQAVANLCNRALRLSQGRMVEIGPAATVVNNYISSTKVEESDLNWSDPQKAPGNEHIRMKSVHIRIADDSKDPFITVRTPIRLDVEFWSYLENCKINVNVKLMTLTGECIFNMGSHTMEAKKAVLCLTTIIPGNLLNNNTYIIGLTVVKNHSVPLYDFPNVISFDVEDVREGIYYFGTWPGLIRPQIESYFYAKDPLPEV